jgi:hypothetical protein
LASGWVSGSRWVARVEAGQCGKSNSGIPPWSSSYAWNFITQAKARAAAGGQIDDYKTDRRYSARLQIPITFE